MNESETLLGDGLNATNGTVGAPTNMISPTMIAVIFMLSCFFILGTIGNALAFIIYYRKREKGTSTIFIISLTVVDFLTCLIAIPWTITHELIHYKYNYDILCRLYVFMSTFNIPLSALILVVIGFDRYFCICHPFLHVITVPRSKIIVFVLIVVAILLGVVPFLGHSIYYPDKQLVNITVPVDVVSTDLLATGSNQTISDNMDIITKSLTSSILPVMSSNPAEYLTKTTSVPESSTSAQQLFTDGLFLNPDSYFLDEMQHGGVSNTTEISPGNFTLKEINRTVIVRIGYCVMSDVTISKATLKAYQGFYASLFLLEFVVIMILYALIFRSIILRRAWRAKRRQKSSYSTPSCVDAEETQLTNVNGNSTETTTVVKKNSSRISAAMRDRTLYANIRTAAMLFVVTVVFVVSFLPSWLTGLRMIKFEMLVFYIYYFNNVANPIIYAFMNRTFRDELVLLIKNCLCRR